MKKYFGTLILILILGAVFFGLNKISAKPHSEQNSIVFKQGIEINVYNAELTNVINNPSAPLAGNVYVDLPAGSCINFKFSNPNTLEDTPMSGCYFDRTKPLPDIFDIAKNKRRINVYGDYDFLDCHIEADECVHNLIINKIESYYDNPIK